MSIPDPPLLRGLTVVLPCRNEAATLRAVVRAATEAGERCAHRHELVIVDDGSTDDTIAVAGDLASHDPRVGLVVHASNRGYGEALRSGIAAARLDWVLMIGADLQLDPAELQDFLAPARAADLVVGRRTPLSGSTVWRAVLQLALNLPFGDVDCGYRLARRELLEGLGLHADGALAGAELLVKSRAAGARISEVAVHPRSRVAGRRASSGSRWSPATLRELVALRRELPVSRIGT